MDRPRPPARRTWPIRAVFVICGILFGLAAVSLWTGPVAADHVERAVRAWQDRGAKAGEGTHRTR